MFRKSHHVSEERMHPQHCAEREQMRTMVLGWLSYEKPVASPESSAIMRIPSAAPTIDPTMASSALWNVAPRLLLKATTA